jgi:hypothetical protein
VYKEYNGIKSIDALAELQNRITEFAAKDNADQEIVVEAIFGLASTQRVWLDYVAEANDYEEEFIEFDTPLDVCV